MRDTMRIVKYSSDNIIMDILEIEIKEKKDGTLGNGFLPLISEQFMDVWKYGGRIEIRSNLIKEEKEDE